MPAGPRAEPGWAWRGPSGLRAVVWGRETLFANDVRLRAFAGPAALSEPSGERGSNRTRMQPGGLPRVLEAAAAGRRTLRGSGGGPRLPENPSAQRASECRAEVPTALERSLWGIRRFQSRARTTPAVLPCPVGKSMSTEVHAVLAPLASGDPDRYASPRRGGLANCGVAARWLRGRRLRRSAWIADGKLRVRGARGKSGFAEIPVYPRGAARFLCGSSQSRYHSASHGLRSG